MIIIMILIIIISNSSNNSMTITTMCIINRMAITAMLTTIITILRGPPAPAHTEVLDFGGFDSSRSMIDLEGWNSQRSVGSFQERLGRRILAGTILVGRLGAVHPRRLPPHARPFRKGTNGVSIMGSPQIQCVFDRGTFGVLPLTYFYFCQKCQGVPFSPIGQKSLLVYGGPVSVDPICPQPAAAHAPRSTAAKAQRVQVLC